MLNPRRLLGRSRGGNSRRKQRGGQHLKGIKAWKSYKEKDLKGKTCIQKERNLGEVYVKILNGRDANEMVFIFLYYHDLKKTTYTGKKYMSK